MKKRRYNKKEIITLLIYVLVIVVLSIILTFFLPGSEENVFDTSFSVPIMLTIIGVSIAMFSFVSNSVQNIEKSIERKKIKADSKRRLYNHLDKMFLELSEDIKFLFYMLVGVLVISIIEDLKFDFLIECRRFDFSKRSLLLFFKICATLASILAIKDIISCIIKISRLGRIINKKEQSK